MILYNTQSNSGCSALSQEYYLLLVNDEKATCNFEHERLKILLRCTISYELEIIVILLVRKIINISKILVGSCIAKCAL